MGGYVSIHSSPFTFVRLLIQGKGDGGESGKGYEGGKFLIALCLSLRAKEHGAARGSLAAWVSPPCMPIAALSIEGRLAIWAAPAMNCGWLMTGCPPLHRMGGDGLLTAQLLSHRLLLSAGLQGFRVGRSTQLIDVSHLRVIFSG